MTSADDLLSAAKTVGAAGLNSGTSGNLSTRLADGFLITPSAVPVDGMVSGDMVQLRMDGEQVGGGVRSSEWRIHRDVYAAFDDAGAIVHAHSPYATALAALREDLPPFHYLVGKAGGSRIRCARYATYGTQELSDAVIEALGGSRACLMANHGMLVYGASLAVAVALAIDVEVLCQQYLIARAAGDPVLLTDQQMDEAIDRFLRYGLPESDQ
ncbi:MAG: class II aldolase [Actinomycetales bacterium]|nr:class II aldolase [Actinomycetales bacterium]